MIKDNVNIANVRTNFRGLMRKWMSFTYPFHNLTETQQIMVAEILYHYFKFKKELDNEDIIWKMVFDYNTKVEIKTELDMKDHNFQNNLTNLRKKGVIKDNKIIKSFIPNVKMGSKNFKIIFNFDITNG